MRRTRWTFALAMLFLAVGVTRPESEPGQTGDTPIDFTGIEHLHLQADGRIVIEMGGGVPGLSIPDWPDVDVVVERDGDTVHVTASPPEDTYYSGTLIVPARLQSIDIRGGADVTAKRPVRELRITTDSALDWKGDAARLEIVRRHEGRDGDAGATADHDDCDCDGVVDVDGAIDELFVTADAGRVFVDRAHGHGHVTLDLADGVTFDLEDAVDLEGVTLRRRPAVTETESTTR